MTSPVETVVVRCPECGHEYEDWCRASINAQLDPEIAADEAYMQEASSATCPRCGHRVSIGVLWVDAGVWRFGGATAE